MTKEVENSRYQKTPFYNITSYEKPRPVMINGQKTTEYIHITDVEIKGWPASTKTITYTWSDGRSKQDVFYRYPKHKIYDDEGNLLADIPVSVQLFAESTVAGKSIKFWDDITCQNYIVKRPQLKTRLSYLINTAYPDLSPQQKTYITESLYNDLLIIGV